MNIEPFENEQTILNCLFSYYVEPAENWWSLYYDETNRWLFTIAPRPWLFIDEPNFIVTPELEKILDRLDKRNPSDATLHRLPVMPDQEQIDFVRQFIH